MRRVCLSVCPCLLSLSVFLLVTVSNTVVLRRDNTFGILFSPSDSTVFKLSFITMSVLTGSVPISSKFNPTRVGKIDNSETFSAVSRKKLICDPCYYMSLIGSRIHMSYRISIGISISVTLNDPYDQRGSTVLTHHLT